MLVIGETRKTKIRKTNLECALKSTASLLVRSTDPVAEARTHRKKARCMRHPRLVLAARAHPTVGERSRNVSWNQSFHEVRAYRGLGCVGEYLYGAPVLVPVGPPVVGPRNYGAAGETRKTKIRKNEPGMCPGINSFTFWYPNFTLQIRCAGQGSRRGVGSPSEPGPTAVNVDSKRVKRTSRAIMLKENEICVLAANELRGVKFFAKSPSPNRNSLRQHARQDGCSRSFPPGSDHRLKQRSEV